MFKRSFSPDDALKHAADGAERAERGDSGLERGVTRVTQSQEAVHGAVTDQQPAQVVALEREAGHHTQTEAGHLGPGLPQTLDTGLDLDPEHQLHHPGEGGPDQGDELDQRHLLRVLPGGQLDAVAQVEQPLLLVLDLLQLETPLRGRVAGVAGEVAVVHGPALLVLTLQEEKLDLMSEIVNLGDEAGLGAVRHLPAIT